LTVNRPLRISYRRVVLPLIPAVVTAAAALALAWFWNQLHQPFGTGEENPFFLVVEPGMTGSEVGRILEESGIIRSRGLFSLYLKVTGTSGRIQAGEYRFEMPLSTIQVADRLVRGQIYYHRVTIPEGLDRIETGSRFIAAGFGTREGFRIATTRTELIRDLDPEAADLEGYLFPDTYYLTRGMGEDRIIELMVSKHRGIWTLPRRRRLAELKMTLHEIVTLASLIEKETSLDSERALISAVFHNRIRRGMKLSCDPTVIFAVKLVKPYDGIINQSDLKLDSPYNTYLYPGLPPGPIASPGFRSIDAALYPAESDYLYFVSKNDGSHQFSTTYRQHAAAVQRYQR